MTKQKSYLPAAGHDWFLPLYDPFVRLLGGNHARRTLLRQAEIRPGERVLDVGCGTGTFAVMLKQLHPGIAVVGLDPDPKALARAAKKAQLAGVGVDLDHGFADELPYPDASFDRVFSSLMLHHVPAEEKPVALREIHRVLRPGGVLHLLDFADGHGTGVHVLLDRFVPWHAHLADNGEDRVLAALKKAGLADAAKIADGSLLLARLAYYRVTRR